MRSNINLMKIPKEASRDSGRKTICKEIVEKKKTICKEIMAQKCLYLKKFNVFRLKTYNKTWTI